MTKAHRYEPIVNESYLDMASHFGVAVVPARPYRPRDKAYATDCTSFVGSVLRAWLSAAI
ncbi:MAG: hypothetical protein ACYDA0_14020 [Candidatus Dormibacteraceae bacterium]